jgi:isopenicillin N synthase-like dioxygenase
VKIIYIILGFFLVSNFQEILPQSELEKMFKLANEFFTLPHDEKVKLKGSENRGLFLIFDPSSFSLSFSIFFPPA